VCRSGGYPKNDRIFGKATAMDHLLYYPYINLSRTEWTLRALLYYDTVGRSSRKPPATHPRSFSTRS